MSTARGECMINVINMVEKNDGVTDEDRGNSGKNRSTGYAINQSIFLKAEKAIAQQKF